MRAGTPALPGPQRTAGVPARTLPQRTAGDPARIPLPSKKSTHKNK